MSKCDILRTISGFCKNRGPSVVVVGGVCVCAVRENKGLWTLSLSGARELDLQWALAPDRPESCRKQSSRQEGSLSHDMLSLGAAAARPTASAFSIFFHKALTRLGKKNRVVGRAFRFHHITVLASLFEKKLQKVCYKYMEKTYTFGIKFEAKNDIRDQHFAKIGVPLSSWWVVCVYVR